MTARAVNQAEGKVGKKARNKSRKVNATEGPKSGQYYKRGGERLRTQVNPVRERKVVLERGNETTREV